MKRKTIDMATANMKVLLPAPSMCPDVIRGALVAPAGFDMRDCGGRRMKKSD
jgi:hypothetical protein